MFVLKHVETGELFASTLVNIYEFSYHGVKAWENEEEARAEYASFLVGRGVDEPWAWTLFELPADKIKLGNVKLNNNPAKRLYWTEDGRLEARNA